MPEPTTAKTSPFGDPLTTPQLCALLTGNGERVQLAIDSKGKVSLIDTAFTRAEENRPADFTVEPIESPVDNSRSIEIAEYIGKLGKLYSHCYKTAANELDKTPLATPEVKDVATALFIQTVRHFSL